MKNEETCSPSRKLEGTIKAPKNINPKQKKNINCSRKAFQCSSNDHCFLLCFILILSLHVCLLLQSIISIFPVRLRNGPLLA